MYFLAENWLAGYIVMDILVVGIYLIFSIRLIKTSRKIGYDVGASALLPVINILIWLKKCNRSRKIKKQNKPFKENEQIKL